MSIAIDRKMIAAAGCTDNIAAVGDARAVDSGRLASDGGAGGRVAGIRLL